MEAATKAPEGQATEDELARKRAEAEGGEGGDAGESGKAETSEGASGAGEKTDLEGEEEGELPPEAAIVLQGDGQLSLKIGGLAPKKATVKLRGGSIEIPSGQYDKGATVDLMVRVQCAEIHLVDKIDNSTGEIVETERRHIFKIKNVERV